MNHLDDLNKSIHSLMREHKESDSAFKLWELAFHTLQLKVYDIDRKTAENEGDYSKKVLDKMCLSILIHIHTRKILGILNETGHPKHVLSNKIVDVFQNRVTTIDNEIKEISKDYDEDVFDKHIQKAIDVMQETGCSLSDLKDAGFLKAGETEAREISLDKSEVDSLHKNIPHFAIEIGDGKQCQLKPNAPAMFFISYEFYNFEELDHAEIEKSVHRIFAGWDSALGKRLKLIFDRAGFSAAWHEYMDFLSEKSEYLAKKEA